MDAPLRVALCDDDPLVRKALAAILDAVADIQIVGIAADGRECLEMVRQHRPDVLVLDVRMPGMGGVDVVRALTAAGATCKIIYLTSYPDERIGSDAYQGIVAGALTKDLDPPTLVHAIRSAALGLTLLAPTTLARPAPRADDGGSPVGAGLAQEPREQELLLLLLQGASNAEIAETMHFSESWVKSTIRELMRRTGTSNRVGLAMAALASADQPAPAPSTVMPPR